MRLVGRGLYEDGEERAYGGDSDACTDAAVGIVIGNYGGAGATVFLVIGSDIGHALGATVRAS